MCLIKASRNAVKISHNVIIYIYIYIPTYAGTAVVQWLRCCTTIRKVAVSEFFNDIKSFRSHFGPEVDSVSNRNEYQEYFLGQRRPVRKADNLPPTCAVVTKFGNLNFWKPLGSSGPVTGLLYLYIMSSREATCWRMLFAERPDGESRRFLLIFRSTFTRLRGVGSQKNVIFTTIHVRTADI